MVTSITTIRMCMETKQELASLKFIDREPYENVIKRLIEYFKEDLELTEDSKKLILERIEEVKKGNVMSTRELYQKLKKREERENKKKR